MKNILVTIPLTDIQKDEFVEIGKGYNFYFNKVKEIDDEIINDLNVIIGNVPPEMIKKAINLEWFQLNSAGYDSYVSSGVLNEKFVMTNAKGAYGVAVSEHLVAMIFAVSKKLHLYRDSQLKNEWADYGEVLSLHDKNVLIIGLGDIGLHTAKLLSVFGNRVVGIKRKIDFESEFVDLVVPLEDLNEQLKIADIVISCLPLSETTKGLFSTNEFKIMKKNAIFFNVGRGEVVDSKALELALINKEIMAAGIDTVDPEPLPLDDELWKIPNLLITPHISGGYHMAETLERIVNLSKQNFIRFINKEKLINHVND